MSRKTVEVKVCSSVAIDIRAYFAGMEKIREVVRLQNVDTKFSSRWNVYQRKLHSRLKTLFEKVCRDEEEDVVRLWIEFSKSQAMESWTRVAIGSKLIGAIAKLDPDFQLKLDLRLVEKDRPWKSCKGSKLTRLDEDLTLILKTASEMTTKEADTVAGMVTDFRNFHFADIINNGGTIYADSSLSIICHESSLPGFNTFYVEDPTSICKKILAEGISSDLVIETKDGSRIPCHKCFLVAQSEPLKTLFESDFVEASTNTLKLETMDEDGVKALLQFLYFWDMGSAKHNSRVGLQLLSAGHMYMIETLQKAMKKLLLGQSDEWFELDDALKMYMVAQGTNGTGDPELVEKLVNVIISKGREAIMASSTFHQFFRAEPDLALRLCADFVGSFYQD